MHRRAPFHHRRPRPVRRSRSPRHFGAYIDPARFVRRAVITEAREQFVPEHQFSDFEMHDVLKRLIADRGYQVPTPIQDRAIPHALRGDDVVGIANTGTGKTAAFLLPIIESVLAHADHRALIMVPTRELAIQIAHELAGFTKGLRISSAVFVGGTSVFRDVQKARQNVSIVIGTPGRLKDLIERKALRVERMQTVVLDEADRMLDMGFIHDMRAIMAQTPAERRTLFFSATMTPNIERLIGAFLRNPVKISVRTEETADSVDQDVVHIEHGMSKFNTLCELIARPEFERVLVFGATKHGVERLAKDLCAHGIRAESIHGNKTHHKRQSALKAFKDAHARVLVATDVAARGLDIRGITHVINYDLPMTYEDYVHRIGRTGRGGKTGTALTFVERSRQR